jgi:hypothetical protein
MIGPNFVDSRFYVFSVERKGGACWWKPGRRGYTEHLSEAGIYSLVEVQGIVADSRGDDVPVPVNLIDIFAAIARSVTRAGSKCIGAGLGGRER